MGKVNSIAAATVTPFQIYTFKGAVHCPCCSRGWMSQLSHCTEILTRRNIDVTLSKSEFMLPHETESQPSA